MQQEARQLLQERDVGNFLTSQEEEMLLVMRMHPSTVIMPSMGIIFFSILITTICILVAQAIAIHPILTITGFLILILSVMTAFGKIIVDWYFHIYILTNRKILEVMYKPFYSEVIEDVLLDQVRCTEIAVKVNGILNHILNKGDISICFDMPTHQDHFMIYNIAAPHATGILISKLLSSATINRSMTTNPVWYRQNPLLNPHRILTNVMPNIPVSVKT